MRDKILIIFMCLSMMTLGFCAHGIYDELSNERYINGLYIHGSENITTAQEYAYSRESKGDWVCINVAYDMKPKEAYETCVHECSHKAFSEIYAESCEDDYSKCLGWMNEE